MPRDSIRPDENGLDTPRRMSGELISMKEFLSANKVSLAVMQKQLYETAHMQHAPQPQPQPVPPPPPQGPGAVGPLAIASEKFEPAKNSLNCRQGPDEPSRRFTFAESRAVRACVYALGQFSSSGVSLQIREGGGRRGEIFLIYVKDLDVGCIVGHRLCPSGYGEKDSLSVTCR